MFYDGNAKYEPGAIVCRVAPSFVRFGTFQLPASRGGDQLPLVRATADYVIKHHYPDLQGRGAPKSTPIPLAALIPFPALASPQIHKEPAPPLPPPQASQTRMWACCKR